MALRLELLGGFSANLAGQPCLLPTKKVQALLAYLALPAGRYHSREKLTALLWGDTPETQARQSFRQALAMLRRGLGESVPVLTQGDAIALDPQAVGVDVADLERALAEGSIEGLERAAALYRGDLLDGFSLDEAPFEAWRVLERERLHELALEGLAKLLAAHAREGRTEPGIQAARRILALDPLQEAVHRALMRLLLRQGRRAAALQQYQVCVSSLQRELGVEPEEETRELYRELLRGTGTRRPTGAGTRRTPTRGPTAHPALVGRAAELAALRDALERALDHGARVAVVTGEAGIGKTRLIEELSAEAAARGARVLSAWCYETERALPFRPWVDAFRAEQATLDAALSGGLAPASRVALARVFPELARPDEPPETESDEHGLLFEAMGDLAGLVATEEPVVLVLEDLHWADAMSARLLAFLGRRLGPLPVLIVGSTRPEEVVDAPVLAQALVELRAEGRLEEVSLGPLSRDDSLVLARGLRRGADDRLVDQLADELWAVSEGNPFVIVETVRALGQGATPGEPRGSLIARSVRESVARRLARLSDPARRAVETAAVIGRSFPFRLLPDGSGLGEREAATAVEELVRRRVMDAVGEELWFCHDRIRQVAYEDVLPARRTLVHRAVARAIESLYREQIDEVADELGHHFFRAGEVEKALVYLARFAEIATRRYALDSALGALQLASEAVERLPESGRDRRRLDVALRQAFVLGVGGRHRECLDVLRAAAPLRARLLDPTLATEYDYRLTMAAFFLGDYGEARRAGEAALRQAEAIRDDERIGKALYALALTSVATGDGRAAAGYCLRAVPVLDRPPTRRRLAQVYWLLALDRIYAGQFDAATEHVGRSTALAEAVGDPKLRSLAGGLESWIHVARGDGAAALECAQRALDAAQGTVPTSLAQRWVGYAHLHRGDAEPAIRVLEQACQRIEHFPVRHTYVESVAFLAEAYLLGGDPARGLATARRAIELARAEGSPFNVGLAERAAGRSARVAGDAAASESHLSRALDAFLSTEAAFEAALTRLDLARTHAARGDTDGGRTQLRQAIDALAACGVPRRVAEARDLARALGLDNP